MDPLGFAVRWALLASILMCVFVPIIFLFGMQWREAEDRARARRLAEYRMNARLLRLNI
jgi:nucleoside permease NupC